MKKIFAFLVLFVLLSSFVASELQYEQLIKDNLDKVDLKAVPKGLKFVLGKPKINIRINGDVYGFQIAGDKVKDFTAGGLEKPNYELIISEQTLQSILTSENPVSSAEQAYLDGKVAIEAKTFGAKMKFWIARKFMGFGKKKAVK